MRIVAGTYRGRALVAPKGHSTRPTADRTREAMFNVLEHAPWSAPFAGARVLDLFAGSGALGLEALSRGAAFCLFVDTDPDARATIGANLRALGLSGKGRVERRDATSLGAPPSGDRFDLAFLDAPYGLGMNEAALTALSRQAWLASDAIVVVERGAGEAPMRLVNFEMLDVRGWGAARVGFLKARSSPPE
jgi:16S rRNA (guanine966-N2)-methyltransferase